MTLIAALDTIAVAWALRDPEAKVHKKDREKQKRAVDLFRWLDHQKASIVIPTVAATEILTPLDADDQLRMLQLLSSRCRMPPFDVQAAAIAADLYRRAGEWKTEYAKASSPTRLFRADTLIVATAKSAGATHFFSDDKRCRGIASLAALKAMKLEEDPNLPLYNQPPD